MLLALALLAWWGTQQLGQDIPPLEIHYLGPAEGGQAPPAADPGTWPETPPARATVLLIKGGFTFGGEAMVKAGLDSAPGVKTIAFDSPGGRIGVADGIAGLIHSRHLATTVGRYCASACTVAYVAGQPRSAARAAQFLFHLGSAPVLTDMIAAAGVQIERPWFVRGGVSLSFVNRALHAPNGEPYRAPLDELVAAGYVQRVEPPLTETGADAGLAGLHALLAAVQAVEPDTRRVLGWAHGQRLAKGVDAARSADSVELNAGLVANRWLGRSSDAAAIAFVDATVAAMDETAANEPTGCMRWQVGLRRQVDGLQAIPPYLRDRLRAAQALVLRDAKMHPNPVPADRDAMSDADQAVRRAVLAEYGARALIDAATPEHAFDDPARSCAAGAAYLRGLRNRPEGGHLIRWALAAG